MRWSLLQVARRQTSMPSDDRSADPAPVPSRTLSDEAIVQQIEKLRQMEMDQPPRGVDTQPNNNTYSTRPFLNGNLSSILVNSITRGLYRAQRTLHLTRLRLSLMSLSLPAKTQNRRHRSVYKPLLPKDPKREVDPDPPKVGSEVVGLTSFQTEDLNLATDGAKSMIMDEVMVSAVKGRP
ncbi:hypothetical protein HO173_000599 [Letharia columbiana]|uniref:Uncharacterized protein n=1 Tax=Letharia columbiana TaxID=112416 RepID=A0A8H6LAY4_9LECA|nr:uncharacterized protein HO173_000599 [Letharia columbiana]KAF6241887.1 hypothetical protein HO173_000599 [Letharia columbiana]